MTVQELYDILSEYVDHKVVVSDSDMMRYEIENVYNGGNEIQMYNIKQGEMLRRNIDDND